MVRKTPTHIGLRKLDNKGHLHKYICVDGWWIPFYCNLPSEAFCAWQGITMPEGSMDLQRAANEAEEILIGEFLEQQKEQL